MKALGVVFVVIVGVLLSRLFISAPAITGDHSLALAACLPPVQIGANTEVTLSGLPENMHSGKGILSTDAAEKKESKSPRSVQKLAEIVAKPIVIHFIAPPGQKIVPVEFLPNTAGKPQVKQIRVEKGEFVSDGVASLALKDKAPLLFNPGKEVRFLPAASTSYVVNLDPAVEFSGSEELPAGTKGTVELKIPASITLITAEPVAASPLLYATPPSLRPASAFGKDGGTALLFRPALAAAPGNAPAACVSEDWAAPIRAAVDGGASANAPFAVQVMNDDAVFSTDHIDEASEFFNEYSVAVVSADGAYASYGGMVSINRFYALLFAIAATGALFVALLYKRAQDTSAKGAIERLSGLFVSDADKDPSLSLFQIFVWTVITVWGFLYSLAVTGNLLNLNDQILILLGISGAGGVGARLITQYKGGSTSQGTETPVQPGSFNFWDMLNTEGRFDLLKLQLFVFTLLVGVYVVSQIAVSGAFPNLDPSTLLLMGVSNGVYLGGKFGGIGPYANLHDLDLRRRNEQARVDEYKQQQEKIDAQISALKTEQSTLTQKKTADPAGFSASEESRLVNIPGLITAAGAEKTKITGLEKIATDEIARLNEEMKQAMKKAGLPATT